MEEGGLDVFPFCLQASSPESTTCIHGIRNEWLWALLSLFILWGRIERLK